MQPPVFATASSGARSLARLACLARSLGFLDRWLACVHEGKRVRALKTEEIEENGAEGHCIMSRGRLLGWAHGGCVRVLMQATVRAG